MKNGLYIEKNLKAISTLLIGKKIEEIRFFPETKSSYWEMQILLEDDYIIKVDGINKPSLI